MGPAVPHDSRTRGGIVTSSLIDAEARFISERNRLTVEYEAAGLDITAIVERLDESVPDELAARWASDLSAPGRTWTPVNLDAVLDGTYVAPTATVGGRSDGVGLFYRGRVHEVAAEPEAGKTWLGLDATAHEIAAGHSVGYLDFEDDEAGIVGRLMTMGVAPEAIRRRFAYVRPTTPILAEHNFDDLNDLLDLRPTLVVIDGVTEAMSLHGLEIMDNTDVATFDRLLSRNIANHLCRPAVVKTDHLVKNKEARGRYSIGGQHKLAGLNGAAYRLENRKPFGVGVTGRSGIFIAKDRPGGLRRHALPSAAGMSWFGDLTVESLAGGIGVEVAIVPPEASRPDNFRPTTIMARICDVLTRAPEPLSGQGIQDRVQGKAEHIRAAIAALIDEGFVTIESGSRGAKLHHLVRPFDALI
jgi:hypothetical protein